MPAAAFPSQSAAGQSQSGFRVHAAERLPWLPFPALLISVLPASLMQEKQPAARFPVPPSSPAAAVFPALLDSDPAAAYPLWQVPHPVRTALLWLPLSAFVSAADCHPAFSAARPDSFSHWSTEISAGTGSVHSAAAVLPFPVWFFPHCFSLHSGWPVQQAVHLLHSPACPWHFLFLSHISFYSSHIPYDRLPPWQGLPF